MPKPKSDRPAWRPRHWLNWVWWTSGETPTVEPDIDRYRFLEMLLLAETEPLEPYGLARKLDPARHISLGHKLKRVLDAAKLMLTDKGLCGTTLTDEEIRLAALWMVKNHIVFSSLTVDEHRQLDAAEHVVTEMQQKLDREMERLDVFIKSRTKSTT
jgi:hypothetical protein